MKNSEIISTYRESIEARMVELYRIVLNSDGRIQYKLYVWSDGELEALEDVQGSNSYLQERDGESRSLTYVATIASPSFDPWDYADHSAPEDEDERDAEAAEIIDWMVNEYENHVSDVVDEIISDLEREERWS